MPSSLESVEADALQLSDDDRAELIERLANTLVSAPLLHPAWKPEIARRVAEMNAGRTRFIPAEKAIEQLAAHIESRRPSE